MLCGISGHDVQGIFDFVLNLSMCKIEKYMWMLCVTSGHDVEGIFESVLNL